MSRTKTKPQLGAKAHDLAFKKFQSSGLDMKDAELLGMEVISPQATSELYYRFKSVCSIKINYYDPFGKPLSDWPKGESYFRIRYLESGTEFSDIAEKKESRYVQLPGTAPVAYYPKNQTWSDIIKDPAFAVIITEGELKAAKACKEGFPTIGIGGVYSWKSPKNGMTFIPSLEFVNWVRRPVYIVFDSDYRTNDMVCTAIKHLADELNDRGANCMLVSLPDIEGFKKIGLDDFLTFSNGAVESFEELLRTAEPLGLSKPLWAMNEKYVYVRSPGLIVHQETGDKIGINIFKDHLELPTKYQERTVREDGSISYKPVSAAAKWLSWPLRCEATKVTYKPGKLKFVDSQFNCWPGWAMDPKKGDCGPFLELINHIFTGMEKEAKEWFLHWCAYPIQNPGTKMFSSAVLHGIRHGTGKSLIGYTLGKIYGKNFTEINQMDIHNQFNEWAENKQFVMGDDVTGSNKRQDADFLKKMITQREIRLNPKYIASYVVPDCINYFFTANHPDSFFLEDDDRRFFIGEVTVGPMDQDFYTEYDLWLDSGGAAAVFHMLLNLDLGDFNPAAPAFKTSAKERMIANVQSDLAGWVRQLMTNPDHILTVGSIKIGKDLFTSKELLDIYDPIGKTGTTANGLGRELARAGLRQVCHGKPIRAADGSQSRYYAVRNADHWAKVDKSVVVSQHLDQWLKKKGFKSGK